MRHACLCGARRQARSTPGSVGPLAIAVIKAPLGALLVAPAGRAESAGAAFPPTREAAVGMAPITRGTEEEGLLTEAAGPHQEDLHGPAGPEISGGARQTREGVRHLEQAGPRPPRGGSARGPGAHSSRLPSLHLRGRGSLPENSIILHSDLSAEVRIYTLLSERQQNPAPSSTAAPGAHACNMEC